MGCLCVPFHCIFFPRSSSSYVYFCYNNNFSLIVNCMICGLRHGCFETYSFGYHFNQYMLLISYHTLAWSILHTRLFKTLFPFWVDWSDILVIPSVLPPHHSMAPKTVSVLSSLLFALFRPCFSCGRSLASGNLYWWVISVNRPWDVGPPVRRC